MYQNRSISVSKEINVRVQKNVYTYENIYIHVTKDVPYLQLMLGLEGVIIRRIKQTYPLSVLSIKTNIQNKKDNIQNKKKLDM